MLLGTQTRETAGFPRCSLADYLRTLICLGAAFFCLSFGSQDRKDAASTLLGGLELLRLSRGFSLSSCSHRPYKFRGFGRKSTSTTLSLPRTICDLVATYAGDNEDLSRNETYSKCFAARPTDLPESANNHPTSFAEVGLVLRAGLSWHF